MPLNSDNPTKYPNGIMGILVDEDGNPVAGGGAAALDPQASPADLTDNTTGTPSDTLAALADGTTYATDVAAIRSNFASLAAKQNEVLAALVAAGVLTAA